MAIADNSVSVVAGDTNVVGNVTQFGGYAGDLFLLNGLAVEVHRVVSTSLIVLETPWPGPTIDGATNWSLLPVGPAWQTSVTVNTKITDLLSKLDANLPLRVNAEGSLTDRAQYDPQSAGFVFLRSDSDPQELYVRVTDTIGVWSAPIRLQTSPADSTVEAEAARDAALTSASAASTSANSAAASATTAGTARDAAVAARDITTAARDITTGARDAALTAQTGAQAARTGAETAQSITTAARDVTTAARDVTTAARDTALSAQGTAVGQATVATQQAGIATTQAGIATTQASAAATSRQGADTAYSNTLGLFGSAQAVSDAVTATGTARDQAVTARQGAESARDLSLGYRNDAQAAAASASAASGIPAISADDRGKVLAVKSDLSGIEWSDDVEALALAGL